MWAGRPNLIWAVCVSKFVYWKISSLMGAPLGNSYEAWWEGRKIGYTPTVLLKERTKARKLKVYIQFNNICKDIIIIQITRIEFPQNKCICFTFYLNLICSACSQPAYWQLRFIALIQRLVNNQILTFKWFPPLGCYTNHPARECTFLKRIAEKTTASASVTLPTIIRKRKYIERYTYIYPYYTIQWII